MNRVEQDLYDGILSKNLADKQTLDEKVSDARSSKTSFLHFLLSDRSFPEESLLEILSGSTGISFVNIKSMDIDETAVKFVPVRTAWHYEFMPLSYVNNKLTVAVNVPLSIRAQDEIRLGLGCQIGMVLAKKAHIYDLLTKHYGFASDTVDRMIGYGDLDLDKAGASLYGDVENIAKKADDASVARLVNQIILEAFKKRATDIHIEPFRGKLALRYRIDGKLHEQPVSEDFMKFLPPILSRIKIMANLNIVEKRIPQDGRAMVKIEEEVLDLRVSFMPTPHGESVVIRILPSKVNWGFNNLGLLPEDIEKFNALLKNTSGIVLVTGPTGSGKTTTLYACIEKLNTKDRKILSIEDPIEYEIKGVVQVQVNPNVGLTFAKGLRSMLRQDPDVMMVGEIRDDETAEIAIRIALTGHLVLSTLHTNDAASGITRALDIGVPAYLITSTVRAFIAQRLIRKICLSCKEEEKDIDAGLVKLMKDNINASKKDIKIYRGKGCEKCSFTGFYGRTAIYEILVLNDTIRKMILDGDSAMKIKKKAMKDFGMRNLIQDGLIKVTEGITTPGEVLDACQDMETMDPDGKAQLETL